MTYNSRDEIAHVENLLKRYIAKYRYLYLKLQGQFFRILYVRFEQIFIRPNLEALVTIKIIYSSVYGGTYIKIAFHA